MKINRTTRLSAQKSQLKSQQQNENIHEFSCDTKMENEEAIPLGFKNQLHIFNLFNKEL